MVRVGDRFTAEVLRETCSSDIPRRRLRIAGRRSERRSGAFDRTDGLAHQHVCADVRDEPTSVDPYGGCPAGTRDRRLNLNEPLPYYRHDVGDSGHPLGFHDTTLSRSSIAARRGRLGNDFDFDYSEPYGVMHSGDGDGYDVYRVANGWVSGGDTRDGGGYSQSFFGEACSHRRMGAFPGQIPRDLRLGAQGRTIAPMHGPCWERASQAWPGRCERGDGLSTTTLTTWSYSPGHEFGGLGGRESKQIDAIIATHGSALPPNSLLGRLHLEPLSSRTSTAAARWEAWISNPGNPPKATANCKQPPTQMTYEGHVYTLSSLLGLVHYRDQQSTAAARALALSRS